MAGEKRSAMAGAGKAHEHGFAADPVTMFDEPSGGGLLKNIEDGIEKSSRVGGRTAGRIRLPFHRHCKVHS